MQQFYHFIQGKAKNPSNEMLSYVNFDNGVESEWAAHPDRTYTYPLRNSILNSNIPGYGNLSQDYLYQKWVAEGSDYPPLTVNPDYSSDILSYESRIPYSMTLQTPFSFIDTEITTNQKKIPQFTPTIFHFDNCRIPGKTNPIWTIKDNENNKIEVISSEDKLMWNFTKPGTYSVSLSLQDSNGNKASVEKRSFFIVE
jgi:PKD repeat protein